MFTNDSQNSLLKTHCLLRDRAAAAAAAGRGAPGQRTRVVTVQRLTEALRDADRLSL